MLLADLGADVVKVEPPDGDETRSWGPPWWGDPADRRSAYFASVNRNKRSVVLDLRTDDGRAALRPPAGDGRRPRPQLPTGDGRATWPRRPMRSATAIRGSSSSTVGGFAGAEADRPAYDLLAQAVSGLMSVTGEPDGPPMKVGVALLDLIAGLECAVGALAALVGRRGSSASVNLVEAGVTSLINVLGNHLATGAEPGRHGTAHPNIAPYQSFEARDGHLVVAVGNDAQFARLLSVLDLTDADGRFATNAQRVGARDELAGWLGDAIATWDRGRARGCAVGRRRAGRPRQQRAGGARRDGSGVGPGARWRSPGAGPAARRRRAHARCGGRRPAWASTPKRCSPSSSEGGGAGDGDRTRDMQLGRLPLCQLSYSRTGFDSITLSQSG